MILFCTSYLYRVLESGLAVAAAAVPQHHEPVPVPVPVHYLCTCGASVLPQPLLPPNDNAAAGGARSNAATTAAAVAMDYVRRMHLDSAQFFLQVDIY